LGKAFRSTDGAATWADVTGAIHLTDGTTATQFPRALNNVIASPLRAGQYGVSAAGGRFYVTSDGGANWTQTQPMWIDPTGKILLGGAFSLAFDNRDSSGKTLWGSSRAPTLTDGSIIPDAVGHIFKTTDGGL